MTNHPQPLPKHLKQPPRGHKPAFIGGRVSTVHCQCGWRTGQYFNGRDAWSAYREHEHTIEQEQKP